MSYRVRLDVIMSQAIEDDFLRGITATIPEVKFTKISGVVGQGWSVPKMGDAIWPQLNSAFVLFCTDLETDAVVAVINRLRKEYAGEGLACFKSAAEEL
jgi:hypothetical protein